MELFGIDDQWTKRIAFDRVRLTAGELREYPNKLKPPPWIDNVSMFTLPSSAHSGTCICIEGSLLRISTQGAGKPFRVCMKICGSDVCMSGGWMEDPSEGRSSMVTALTYIARSQCLHLGMSSA